MKIYVIHAAKLKERGESIDRMLHSKGLDYEFVLEADLENLNKDLLCKYFLRGKEMTEKPLPRYSCATKHFLTYEKIIKEGLEGALVLEDDIVLYDDFLKYFPRSIEELNSRFAGRPAMISYEDSSLRFVPRSQRKKGQMLYPGIKGRMAGAYYMSRQCAEVILKDLDTNKCPVPDADTYHYELLKRGIIDYLWCHPTLATQGSFSGQFKSTLSSKKDRMAVIRWWFKKNYKKLLYWFR